MADLNPKLYCYKATLLIITLLKSSSTMKSHDAGFLLSLVEASVVLGEVMVNLKVF